MKHMQRCHVLTLFYKTYIFFAFKEGGFLRPDIEQDGETIDILVRVARNVEVTCVHLLHAHAQNNLHEFNVWSRDDVDDVRFGDEWRKHCEAHGLSR